MTTPVTARLTGTAGIIMESSGYLELPKGSTISRPSNSREGMMRYNYATKQYEVIVNPYGTILDATSALEWRNLAYLDANGKISSTTLPSSVLGSLVYKGTWDATLNDINVVANESNVVLTPLPAPSTIGFYYIVRTAGDGGGAAHLGQNEAPYNVGDYIVSNGSTWEKIDNSSISTTASSVSFSDAMVSYRTSKLAVDTTSVQTAIEAIILKGFDRTGDTLTGTMLLDSTGFISIPQSSTPLINSASQSTSGLYFNNSNNVVLASNGVVSAEFGSANMYTPNIVLDNSGSIALKNYSSTNVVFNNDSTVFTYNNTPSTTINASGVSTTILKSNTISSADGTASLIFNSSTIQLKLNGSIIGSFSAAGQQSSTSMSFATGTLSAPSLSFTGRIDVGLYSPADHTLAIASNNSINTVFNGSSTIFRQQALLQSGLVTAPSIAFETDTTSGLFQTTSGTLSFSATGVNVGTLSSTSATFNVPLVVPSGTLLSNAIAIGQNGLYSSTQELDVNINGSKTIGFNGNYTESIVPFIAQNGTVSVPTVAFKNYQSTGLYTESGVLCVSSIGTNPIKFGSTYIKTNVPITSSNGLVGSIISENLANGISVSDTSVVLKYSNGNKLTVSNNVFLNTDLDLNSNSLIIDNSSLSTITYNTNSVNFDNSNNTIFSYDSTNVLINTVLSLSDGLVNLPALRFNTSTSTGLFLSNSTDIGFAFNGVSVLEIGSVLNIKTNINLFDSNTINFVSTTSDNVCTIETVSDVSTLKFISPSDTNAFIFGSSSKVYLSISKEELQLPVYNNTITSTNSIGTIRYNNITSKFECCNNLGWDIIGKVTTTNYGSGVPVIYSNIDNTVTMYTLKPGNNISIVPTTEGLVINSENIQELVYISSYITDYILTSADISGCIEIDETIPNTVTIPPDSDVLLPIGSYIMIRQMGAGQTSIAAGSGVTILNPHGTLKLKSQYASCSLHKRDADVWCIEGNLAES